MTTIQSMCALVAYTNWHVHQLDIKTTFLNGDLHEEVHVSQSRGFAQKIQDN